MKILVTENTVIAGAFVDAGMLVEVGAKLPTWTAIALIGDGKATLDPARIATAEAAAAAASSASSESSPSPESSFPPAS